MSHWSIPFDEIARRVNARVEDVVRTFALEAFGRVIERSPVDTGRFKGNWFPSLNDFVAFSPDDPDPTGERTMHRMKTSVMRWPVGGIMYLTNSLPYAVVIEYGEYPNPPKHPTGKTVGGYSTQAPQGVVRVTAQEMRNQLASNFPGLEGSL